MQYNNNNVARMMSLRFCDKEFQEIACSSHEISAESDISSFESGISTLDKCSSYSIKMSLDVSSF